MESNSLLNQFLEIDRERIRRDKVVLHTMWDRLANRVKLSMKARSTACIFEIPEFIPGYPLTKIPETMNYLLNKIKAEGILGVQIDPIRIYIAWDPAALRELDQRIRNKNTQSDNFTHEIQKRDDDFIDILVREKNRDKNS